MPSIAVIIAAAGQSSRFGDKNFKKPFAPLDGKPVWLHSADRFSKRSDVKQMILVIDPADKEEVVSRFGANLAVLGIDLALGGKERADSVRNGLEKVRKEIELVAIHDAARPCVSDRQIDEVFQVAAKTNAAILAVPVAATLKKSQADQTIETTVDRRNLWEAQTPQVFDLKLLQKAYSQPGYSSATDESQLFERAGIPVTLVTSSSWNIKITRREDLKLASMILKSMPQTNQLPGFHPFQDDHLWR